MRNYFTFLLLVVLSACAQKTESPPIASEVISKPSLPAEIGTHAFEVFVSLTGNDTNSGTMEEPFLTIEKALSAVKDNNLKGIPEKGSAIWLREGVYRINKTINITANENNLEILAYPKEKVRITGAKLLDPSWFSVANATSRMNSNGVGSILEIDLPAHGISNYGNLLVRGFARTNKGAMDLQVDGETQTLARWPNKDDHQEQPALTGNTLNLYGTSNPDVSGSYTKIGVNDSLPVFKKDTLVNGKQYHLYHRTWVYNGNGFSAWFLTTSAIGSYPVNTDAWWYFYGNTFSSLKSGYLGTGFVLLEPLDHIKHGYASTMSPLTDKSFSYVPEKLAKWTSAPDAWIEGQMAWLWSDNQVPVSSINTNTNEINLGATPYLSSATTLAEGMPWYIFNLLEELDQPNEWYLDRSSGKLYWWPSKPLNQSLIEVTSLDGDLFLLNNASNVILRNLIVDSSWQNGISIKNGSNNLIKNVIVKNVGVTGIMVNNGLNHKISYSYVSDTGETGVSLVGGDRVTLTAAGHIVENSEIIRSGRISRMAPLVSLGGVGNTATHNHLHDAYSRAVLFIGNDHQVTWNNVYDVCKSTSDAGAIYTGRDWGARGNKINYNYIHDINTIFDGGYGVHGIYLDDAVSGIEVKGNYVYNVSGHAIQHGGGRDNIMTDNILVKNGDALAPDTRGYDWWKAGNPYWVAGTMLTNLKALGYQSTIWTQRYPEAAAIPNDWSVITANDGNPWLYPVGSVFSRNVGFANTKWITAPAVTAWYADFSNNLDNTDPLFVDEPNRDLTLRQDSPVRQIQGIQVTPFKEIGILPVTP